MSLFKKLKYLSFFDIFLQKLEHSSEKQSTNIHHFLKCGQNVFQCLLQITQCCDCATTESIKYKNMWENKFWIDSLSKWKDGNGSSYGSTYKVSYEQLQ